MGTFSTQGHSMGPNRILQGPGGTPLDLMRPKGMPRGPWDPPGPNRTLCDCPAYPDPQVPWDPLTPLRSSPPGLRALGVGGGGLHHPAGEETPHHHLPPCPAARVPGESPGTPPIPRGPRHSGPVTAPPASPPHPILHHPNCPIRRSPSGHPDNAPANPCARPMGRQDCCCHGDGRVAGAAPWQRRIPGTTETKAGGAGGPHACALTCDCRCTPAHACSSVRSGERVCVSVQAQRQTCTRAFGLKRAHVS